jgi:S-DNA-T family DNA segregation ATPase FtsK/SpoIIIE
MAAHTQRTKTTGNRWKITAAAAAVVLVLMLVLARFAPWWGWLLVALGLVVVFARHGQRQAGKPIVHSAVVPSQYEKLTQDIIVRALGSLGLAGIDKVLREGRDIVFVTPVQRDRPGWRVTIDLPWGVVAEEVIARRDKLAAGLRRPAGCVWPQPEHDDHPGRLTLYVGDQPLSKMRQPAWPLARAGQSDIFQPVPFGTDQRGKPQSVTLIWANLLIGAISRMGKTVALRNLLLAAALDPRVEQHVWELKGTGDLRALSKVAHSYGSGADDETIEDCLADLRRVHAELERRAKVLKELQPTGAVPDSKVTPQLASRRSLRLHPLVFAVDECQEAFSHPDLKAEFERLCLALIRRGPALAIIRLLAAQRPDSKSLPTGIRANVALRFCLKVMDDDSNNMILGDGAYRRGINSTLLAFSDKGVGWAVGFADAPVILKSYDIRGPEADRICDRARALRAELGVLSGYAAGTAEADDARSFAVDVLAVYGSDTRLHTATIARRLADRIPGVYADITPAAVGSQLRGLGVKVGNVREPGTQPAPGAYRTAVEAVTQ